MNSKQNAISAVLRDSPFLRRWHCHLCGSATKKVAILCEVPEGEFKGFRVCERCIEKHDGNSTSIDAALRTRAAEIVRETAEEVQVLLNLVGRLEVVDFKTWQTACDAHDQALREAWEEDCDAIDQPFAGEADQSALGGFPF
jgi:hypothetical protein